MPGGKTEGARAAMKATVIGVHPDHHRLHGGISLDERILSEDERDIAKLMPEVAAFNGFGIGAQHQRLIA